jgi:WhiB family redox-sensing transcriptional regulator
VVSEREQALPQIFYFPPQPWKAQAACRGIDPDLFHPPRGANKQVEQAKAFCRECPVRQECLDFALDWLPKRNSGIYGGMSERQRRRIKASRKAS